MTRLERRDDLSRGFKFGPAEVRVVTTTSTIRTGEDGEDGVIFADATAGIFTLTLPKVTDDVPDRYVIKKIDSSGNAVTVDGDGSETIDGAASISLATQYDSATLITDGASWFVVGKVGTW